MAATRSSRAPHGVAVVGCGAWGRNLARCFAELGALAAVVDHHREVAGALASRFGCPALGLDEALGSTAVDAIAVATQPEYHHVIGMAALAAGRHLFVEKPLTLDLVEAEALVAAARARGLALMVGHIMRYHPGYAALQRLVTAGVLGRVLRLQSRRLDLGLVRRTEDALWCLAPHDVSMILGLVAATPATVDALAERALGRPVADAAVVRLGFDAASALIEVSWLHPVKEQRLTMIGTQAMAVLDDCAPWERKLTLYPHRIRLEGEMPAIERGEPRPVALQPEEPLMAECRHFLDRIDDGHEPLTGGPEALAVMQVLARAAQAIAAGDARSETQPSTRSLSSTSSPSAAASDAPSTRRSPGSPPTAG